MDSCQEAQASITPYLDGEAGVVERQHLKAHLERCPACRDEVAAQDTARRVLNIRSTTLHATAPDALRARCRALAPVSRPALARWSPWRVLSLGTATAMGVLASVIVFGVLTNSPVLLAAEMTLDHLKCFTFFDGGTEQPDAASVEAAVRQRFGWAVTVPPAVGADGLVLLGARRCLSHDGKVAHLMYRHEGHPVSLFVMPKADYRPADLALAGYPSHIWSNRDLTYVLVASEPDQNLRPVTAYFHSALR